MAKADASTLEAPLKKEGKGTFLPDFKFDTGKKYVFELASKNLERELPVFDMVTKRPAPHKEFPPYRNIVLTSQIVWEGERRTLRYYDGCTTLFVDEQPKDKEMIDQLIKQSKKRAFIDGKFSCFGEDRMLLIYLNICSWNTESEYRTRTAEGIFTPQNPDKKAAAKSERLDLIEEALGLAKNASVSKMFMHANYLGLPDVDWDSDNKLSDKEMRTAYREEAARDPRRFIDSFGNKAIEIKYYITQALMNRVIGNKMNPNKASWLQSGKEICDISGLKSDEAIAQKLFEFSQTEDGEEFKIQLKAFSEK